MSSRKTTTSKNTPWAPAEPYIKDTLAQTQAAQQQGMATLGLATPGLNAAIAKATAGIETPPAYMTDAARELGRTINGEHIGANPHMSGIADLIAQKVGSQYNSTFGAS